MSEGSPVVADPIEHGDGEAVRVLLVDDNEQWATFLADDLEQHDDDFDVSVALSANEAMVIIDERDDLDCVVADYRMPEVDGLQLLERVREHHQHLPYILVTAAGSEEVASTAIDAGVTDYLIKNPNTEQTPLLARRIKTAVERYSLRLALEESEARYRTVTDQTWDAIVILQDGAVVFCNERFVELTGYDRETLSHCAFIEQIVHEDDREMLQDVLASIDPGDDTHLEEARLATSDGAIRHGELAMRPLSYRNQDSVLVSIRDVTERTHRQQRLDRERALNRSVLNILIESRTREELESAIAQQLHAHGYGLVWIAESVGGELTARVIEGDEAYVSALIDRPTADVPDDEPSVVTTRRREPQFIPDLESLFPTSWRDRALEAGFHSVAAVPIAYDDIVYGVLAAYHPEVGFVDEIEGDLLGEISETIAFAIHHLEAHKTLTAEDTLDVEVVLDGEEYYLLDLLDGADIDVSATTVTVLGTHSGKDDSVVQYVRADGIEEEAFRELVTRHPLVVDTTPVQTDADARLQLTLDGTPPESVLAGRGASVHATEITPNRALIRFEVPSRSALSEAIDALEAAYGEVEMRSVVEMEPDAASNTIKRIVDLSDLTDKQTAALKAALHHGYYEQPRGSSASEIAQALDVTHSTYLQHLRAAQRKVLRQLYGDESEMD